MIDDSHARARTNSNTKALKKARAEAQAMEHARAKAEAERRKKNKIWSGVKTGLLTFAAHQAKLGRDVVEWAKDNRGLLASVAATVGCFIPAVGWVACAGMQAVAYGVRAEQRASEGGGWERTWRANAHDGLFTAATFGVGGGLRFAKFGNLSGLVERARVPAFYAGASWRGGHAYHPLYTLANSAPSIAGVFRDYE